MTIEAQLADLTRLVETLATQLIVAQRPAVKLAYTLVEAGEATGVSPHTLRAEIKRGHLHAKKTGEGTSGTYVIPAEALTAWLWNRPQPITDTARKGVRQTGQKTG